MDFWGRVEQAQQLENNRERGFEGESVGIPCEHLGMHARQYPDPEGNLFRVTDSRLR